MKPGLDGVVVAETVLSHADPARGMLWVRGHAVAELVAATATKVPLRCCGMTLPAVGLRAMP